jgi:hypothetical protein
MMLPSSPVGGLADGMLDSVGNGDTVGNCVSVGEIVFVMGLTDGVCVGE